jgi:drug/metabolite transporter (DMT)-like permease
VILGFLGVLVSAASVSFDIGILLTLMGGRGVGTVYYARNLEKVDVLKLNVFMSVSALPIMLALTPFDYYFEFSVRIITLLLVLSVLAQALAYYLWFNAIRELGSVRASAGSLVTPVVAYAASYLLLHTVPTPLEVVGSAITLLGVYLALSSKTL